MKTIESFKKFLNRFFVCNYFSSANQNLIIALILLLTLVLRLHFIQSPPIDRTAWKEIDYITISKNYTSNGFNFFKPTIFWPAELPRVTAMEFPLVPYLASFLYLFFGVNAYTVRLITLIAFLFLIVLEFKLVKKELGQIPAILAALVSGLLPLNSFFASFLFSEPTMIAFSVFAIYYFSKWMDSGKIKDFVLAIFGFTMAILLKLEPLYLSVIFLGLYIYKYKLDIPQYKKLIFFGLISIILPVAWYGYAYYLTYHSIDVFGIFKGHDKFQTLSMLSHKTWYVFMGRSILGLAGGKVGVFLAILGFISLILVRKGLLFFLYLSAIVFYFVVVAEGNIDGNYRQLVIIPSLSCFMAIGSLSLMYPLSLIVKSRKLTQPIIYFFLSAFIVLLIQFRRYNLETIHSNNPAQPQEWELAGIIKKYSDSTSKLVTLGSYSIHKGGNDLSPVLYYYSGIRGWSLQKNDWNEMTVEKLKNKGADLLVGYNLSREPGLLTFVSQIKNIYPILYENKEKEWIILSLKNQEPKVK